MKWIDINDIAIALEESHPDKDIANLRFTELQKMVVNLEGFSDELTRCNEKVLEAIQAAWLEER